MEFPCHSRLPRSNSWRCVGVRHSEGEADGRDERKRYGCLCSSKQNKCCLRSLAFCSCPRWEGKLWKSSRAICATAKLVRGKPRKRRPVTSGAQTERAEQELTILPCNFPLPDSPSKRRAVAGGCPSYLRSSKTVAKLGTPPAVPSNPNSRRGRAASSLRQGRVAMEKITVGIDVSKDRLDVAVRPSGECFAVPRTGTGLDDLVAHLRVLKPNLIVLEATGGFETVVVAALAAAGLPVAVANPAQIRAFAKAIGQRTKTDPIDAGVIAHFGEATGVVPRPLPDQATQQLADLVARRRQIIDMIGSEKQREKRANPRIKKSIGRLVKALERELSSVDTDIDDAVRGSPAWREKEDLLSSVPSPAISRTLIAELPELGTACRPRPLRPPIGPMAWKELHRRRQGERAQGP